LNLVVDSGNSFSKVGLFENDAIIDRFQFKKLTLNDIEQIFFQRKITNSIFSNVGEPNNKVLKFLRQNSNLVNFNSKLKIPFTNKYSSVETLGNDRVGLVSQASKLYSNKNILIIDIGTSITYDFLNEKNEYLGGSISPGLSMRFKALNNQTHNLPLAEKIKIDSFIGSSTNSSIVSGVINGTLGEINYISNLYKNKFKKIMIILTGGDSKFLFNHIKNGILANSNFLLSGLNLLLELNKKR
tara:strand:+ start:55 stop:780 length:726 start_codon:yes stop_codon:yes gene_type:complete